MTEGEEMIKGIDKGFEPSSQANKPGGQQQRLREACEEFESIMTGYLLKSMRESIDRAEKPEHGREVFESLFDETVSKEMAKRQSNGLSDILYKQLAPQVQEGKKKQPA